MDRRWCVHTLVRPMNGSNGQTMVCPHTSGSSHDERFKWTDDGVSTHWSDRWCVHTLVRPSDHLTMNGSNGQTMVCPHTGQIISPGQTMVCPHTGQTLDHLTMNGSNGQTMVCPHTGQTFGSSHDERFKWTDDGVSTHWSDLRIISR